MGFPFSGEVTGWPCGCDTQGTNPAGTGVQYVISVNGLQGLLTIAPDGGVSVRSEGNTLYIGANGSAGLGTVTSVNASSNNTNLVVSGGPVLTTGTFLFSLAGNLNSISGLTMAADQMLYSTGAATFAATSFTTNARTLVGHTFAQMRSDLGLVIGTNVQAWSAELDWFIANTSQAGANITFAGNVNGVDGTFSGDGSFNGTLGVVGASTFVGAMSAGSISAGSLTGNGAGITGLSAANISAGTLAVARGGTGLASYTTGQILYASGATTIAGLSDVAAGAFVRSGGVGVAPAYSTLILPNAATTGDIFMATGANTMGRLANVATGNVLLSGGVGVASTFGKVTTAHTTGIAASGTNSDITALTILGDVTSNVQFAQSITVLGAYIDSNTNSGNAGDILSSTNTGTQWTDQASLSTLSLIGFLYLSGTLTAAGVTGAQTINKQSGTVRFAAAATTLVITNSLALAASTRAQATVCSNDTTLKSVSAVVTNGFITLNANAAATAETEVYWELRGIV